MEMAPVSELIDVNKYETAKDLQRLGMEELKKQLQLRGMKCGGTMDERAKRLFLCKGVKDLRKLHESLFAKRKAAPQEKTTDEEEEDSKRYRKRQQGPLLEHQEMRRNQKRIPSSNE